MKILITGGAGFIGANLAGRLYAAGHSLVVLDNLSPQIHGDPKLQSPLRQQIDGKCEFVFGDVTDHKTVAYALNGCDAVVHLAAETGTGQSMYEISRYCHTNVTGTAVLLEAVAAAKASVKRVVVASSRAVYGEGKYLLDGQPVYPLGRLDKDLMAGRYDPIDATTGRALEVTATDEQAHIHPNSIYGITKHNQEQMVLMSCAALGIEATALRFQNVYGPGQSLSNPYTGILSIFSNRIRHHRGIDIYEDGLESRDFVYIDDVVTSLTLSLEEAGASGQVFGIGAGVPVSVLTVAQSLARHYGIDVPIKVTGAYRVGDIRHNFADTRKAENLLGFKASVSFDEGIARFARWVSEQPVADDKYEQSLDSLKKRGLYK